MRMKDDERFLLAALKAGERIEAAAVRLVIGSQRLAYLIRRWKLHRWYDEERGRLTDRGMTVGPPVAQAEDSSDDELSDVDEPTELEDDSGDIQGPERQGMDRQARRSEDPGRAERAAD